MVQDPELPRADQTKQANEVKRTNRPNQASETNQANQGNRIDAAASAVRATRDSTGEANHKARSAADEGEPWLERMTPTPWGQMFSRSAEWACPVPSIGTGSGASTSTSTSTGTVVSPVILVPGMIISSHYMRPLAAKLAPYCHVHMIDFPGYGRSEQPPCVLNICELAEALRAWMSANGIARADLVANSFGCQIAAEFAVRHPEMVDKLVLQGPTVDPSARGLFRQMVRLKRNSWRESKSVGMISVRSYRRAGLRRVIKTIRMTLNDHIETKLPMIRAETLVVRGGLDPVVPQPWAVRAARLLPHGHLCVITGGAHTLNYSEPEKFSQVVLRFLGLVGSVGSVGWPGSAHADA